MNIGKKHLNEPEFGVLWSAVEHELYKLFYNNKCSALVVYNNIYIICTDPQNKFVDALYWKLGDFVYGRAKEIRGCIYREEDWVSEYNKGFEKYREYVSSVNELCDFLSQYISAKSLDVFAFILWERCILQTTQKYKGTTLGQYLVTNSKLEDVRSAIESLRWIVMESKTPLIYYVEKYEQYALEKIKSKLEIEVSNFLKGDSSRLGDGRIDGSTPYTKVLDGNSIPDTKLLDTTKVLDSTPYTTPLVINYSKYIFDTIEKQRNLRHKILLEESFDKLDLILQDILVTQRKKFIQTEVFKILSNHKLPVELLDMIRDSGSKSGKFKIETHSFSSGVHPINDFYALYDKKNQKNFTLSSEVLETVSVIFNYLKPIKHSYNIMKNSLVKYISTQMETYSHLLDRRIETLYVFYCMFRNVVEIGFNSDQGCFEVFENRFSEVLGSLRPSLTSRLIEFSSSLVANDNHLFEFLEDKKVVDKLKEYNLDFCREERGDFQRRNRSLTDLKEVEVEENISKTYTPGELLKVLKSSSNEYREGALLRVFYHLYSLIKDTNDFSERYSFELARRLVTGMTDYKKEQDLIQIIKTHSKSDSIRKAEIMLGDIKNKGPFLFLTQCAWPLEHTPFEINLPPFLLRVVEEEEKKYFKRRFLWLWEYSTVYLEIDGVEVRANILQYIVLEIFQIKNNYSKEEISKRTNLKGKNLEWVLLSLLRSNFLTIEKDTVYWGIPPFKANPYDYYIKENLSQDHEINRVAYYQSMVCKIMKYQKEPSFSGLVQRVSSTHSDRFPFDRGELNRGIKGLVEKGILEGSTTLKYVP